MDRLHAATCTSLPRTAPLVIQYFWASVVGVLMTNSWLEGSYTAVVCMMVCEQVWIAT